MNGVLNSGLDFWQVIVLIVVATLSIMAIRISFDINKFLERRDKNSQQKLINACPHFMIVPLEGKSFEIRSLLYKPSGTFQHYCRQCGYGFHLDMEQHEREANGYAKDPKSLIAQQKKFTKLAKKYGKIEK